MQEKNVYLAGMRYERHRTLIENANACRPINGTKNLSSGENGKKAIETKKARENGTTSGIKKSW